MNPYHQHQRRGERGMHGCGPRGEGRHGGGHGGRHFARMAMRFGGGRHGGGFGGGFDGPFGGPFGRDDGDGPGGRKFRGRMFGSGELRLLLLRLVADETRHGYELIKAIEELTGGAYAPSPGVVYPTLSMLVDEGLIEEAPGGGSRKAFAATEAGKAELETRSGEADKLVERLKAVGAASQGRDAPPVRRAMHNLMSVLRHKVAAGGIEAEVQHAIAEILDETARRIERL